MRIRIGAICNDGTHSTATGQGACSHHGGVREWLYVDQQPKTPPKFSQQPKHQSYDNFMMLGKKKEESFQTKTERQLKLLVNQLKGEREQLIKDLTQYKDMANKQVSTLRQKIKQRQKQIQLMQNEKNNMQQRENLCFKQGLNKAAHQKVRYQNAIAHLRKRVANLEADLVIVKQANYVQTQRMIIQKLKQLRSKVEKQLRANLEEELKQDIEKKLTQILQKRHSQEIQQLAVKHKLELSKMQTRFNQLLSYKQTYQLQIANLKIKLKNSQNDLQVLSKEKEVVELELGQYKYKIELVKEEHKENINDTLGRVKKQHEEELMKLAEEKEKLLGKLLQEKENRTKQVARSKSTLIAKHEKQIRQLQQSHQLKQKLWLIGSETTNKNNPTERVKGEKPIGLGSQLADDEINKQLQMQDSQMSKAHTDGDGGKDSQQGMRGNESHIGWIDKGLEVQSYNRAAQQQSRQRFSTTQQTSMCFNTVKVLLLLTSFVALKLLFIVSATLNNQAIVE